jgi:hypothetical protein
MTRIEGCADNVAEGSADRTIMFVLTLIVTTAIVAFAVYVLGSAVLEAGVGGPAHRAAIAVMHAHS